MSNSKNIESGLIWITGFSASGKTTVARKTNILLKENGYQTIFLDGDDLRRVFSEHWGHDLSSRSDLAKVYFHLCSHLSSQGYLVIISAIAMFNEIGLWVKDNIQNSMQIYLKVPKNERRIRDEKTKKIFVDKELNDDYYDAPINADLIIDNYGKTTPDIAANQILSFYSNIKKSYLDRGRDLYWQKYYEKGFAPHEPTPFAKFDFISTNAILSSYL